MSFPFAIPSMRTSASLSCVLLAGAVALHSGCKPKSAASAAPAPPPEVEVTRPLQRDEPVYAEWVGSLDGLVDAQVRAQVQGYLIKRPYAEGSEVKAGDVLFEIDPRPFQIALAQSEANAQKAEADFQRQSQLAQQEVAAKQELDNATAARATARAALDQAKLNLEFTKITSPIDGIAGLANAQIGDLVGPNTGVLTTVSTVDPIKAYFAISEQSYLDFERHESPGHRFPEDMELELILTDGSVYPRKGKFYAIDRQIDPSTGTLKVAGTFPNPDHLLRPGQYARIRAAVAVQTGAIEVPQRAVSELQGGYQLAIVGSDNVVHLRPVKVGERIGSQWIITEGLKPDETVIVEGLQKVREGSKVNPKPYTPAVPSAPVKS
jgi:membrane fusion protein (multidrug efflux system)